MQISTVFQTTPWLAEHLISTLPIENAREIVELGPGAGAITRKLITKMPQGSHYVGIELNLELIQYLQSDFPKLRFVHDSAEQCAKITGPNSVDVVISSLPWTVFPEELQGRILDSVLMALKPGGQFATYVCVNASLLPSADSLKKHLNQRFKQVTKSEVEYRNIPPAFVYTCVK